MKPLPSPKTITITLLALSVFGIILFNTKDVIFGAPLYISAIKDGMSLDENSITVSGRAPHAKEVSINGRTIYTNREGQFTEPILLAPGYNILEVGMVDRFGKTNTKRFELVRSVDEDRFTLLPDPNYQ